jgi:hypothetical protein
MDLVRQIVAWDGSSIRLEDIKRSIETLKSYEQVRYNIHITSRVANFDGILVYPWKLQTSLVNAIAKGYLEIVKLLLPKYVTENFPHTVSSGKFASLGRLNSRIDLSVSVSER